MDLASVLWLPVTAFKYLVGSDDGQNYSPLADASLYLLLILVHHVPYKTVSNPYRTTLQTLHDETYIGGIESTSPNREHNQPAISFSELYRRLSLCQGDERGALMLYTMMQCVPSFKDYVLVRDDVETLLLPILRQLYEISSGSQSQLYLLSILLLIFSQDISFGQNVHNVTLCGPEWYKDRPLGKLSLGSFMIVLLLRMAHSNLVTSKDLYLHTNAMAALANVTSTAVHLDAFAAQRFLGMMDLLTRRKKKALEEVEAPETQPMDQVHVQFYTDFLNMMLEILNGVLVPRPANNLNLVYAVLQRQNLFVSIAALHPDQAELVQDLQVRILYRFWKDLSNRT